MKALLLMLSLACSPHPEGWDPTALLHEYLMGPSAATAPVGVLRYEAQEYELACR